MSYDFDQIESEAIQALDAVQSADELEQLRIKYLGSKGLMKDVMGAIKDVPKEQKRDYGQGANQLKQEMQAAFDATKERIGSGGPSRSRLDVTKSGNFSYVGHPHIITETIEEIVTIFQRLGFRPARGPEVEDEFHNFDALNIPAGHPARDERDNFFLEGHDDGTPKPVPLLLRSQTSTVQVRAIEHQGVPLRVVAPGRVYRPDTVDATHLYQFHQVEGLAIDEGLTFKDLRGALTLFVKEFFGPQTRFRLRPHYFPFTEVSAEVDITTESFDNIKKDWLEILGCGMVHPNVLKACNVNPERYTGFAWGIGVERIVMLRHGISDIRHFIENDLRFLRQFH